MLSSVLRFSRIIVYILSVVTLVSSIKTNNGNICKNNSFLQVFYFIFLIVNINVSEYVGINLGWAYLYILPLIILVFIIMLVNFIVVLFRLKKRKLEYTTTNFMKYYPFVVVAFLIFINVFAYKREVIIISNADVIVEYNYQDGWVTSEDTRFAISESSIRQISIDPKIFNSNYTKLNYYGYSVAYEDGEFIIKGYKDEYLDKIDEDVVQKIFDNSGYDDVRAEFTKIEGTDYYIVEYISGISIIASYVYSGTDKISSIYAHGNIKYIYIS